MNFIRLKKTCITLSIFVLIIGGIGSCCAGKEVKNVKKMNTNLQYVGEMSANRYNHTAINLMNGEVLIVGGQVLTSSPKMGVGGRGIHEILTAEVFNPQVKKFKNLGMLHSGLFANAFLLNDGTVLLIGHKIELYNPTGQFSEIAKIENHGLIKYAEHLDGNDYIIISNAGDIFKFNFETKEITELNKFKVEVGMSLQSQNYIKLDKDRILVYGKANLNKDGALTPVNKMSIYTVSKNEITEFAKTPNLGLFYNAIKSDDDTILFYGGKEKAGTDKANYKTSAIFDVKTKKFTKELKMHNSPASINEKTTPVKLSNGDILMIEGDRIRQKFNSKSQKFDSVDEIKLAGKSQTATMLSPHKILITGGTKTWIYSY